MKLLQAIVGISFADLRFYLAVKKQKLQAHESQNS